MAVSVGRLAIYARWIVGSDAGWYWLNRTGRHGGNVATLRGLNFFITTKDTQAAHFILI